MAEVNHVLKTLSRWDYFSALLRGKGFSCLRRELRNNAPWPSPAIRSPSSSSTDFPRALVCFVLLVAWKAPPRLVVLVAAGTGAGLGLVA